MLVTLVITLTSPTHSITPKRSGPAYQYCISSFLSYPYIHTNSLSPRYSEVPTPIVYSFSQKRQPPPNFTPLDTQPPWPQTIKSSSWLCDSFFISLCWTRLGYLEREHLQRRERSLSKKVSFFYTTLFLILFEITVQSNLKFIVEGKNWLECLPCKPNKQLRVARREWHRPLIAFNTQVFHFLG